MKVTKILFTLLTTLFITSAFANDCMVTIPKELLLDAKEDQQRSLCSFKDLEIDAKHSKKVKEFVQKAQTSKCDCGDQLVANDDGSGSNCSGPRTLKEEVSADGKTIKIQSVTKE